MNKRASVAVMSMEAKKMQQDQRRSEDEAVLASLEAGRALSPTIPLVREQRLPPGIVGEGDCVACKVFDTNQKLFCKSFELNLPLKVLDLSNTQDNYGKFSYPFSGGNYFESYSNCTLK